jgi:hypothetical protein
MISAEYGPGSSHVNLNLGDEAIVAYAQDVNGAGEALREADPVKWLVGTIAVANGEMPSDVSDVHLMAKAVTGQRSMDPTVYNETKNYLGSKGYSWIGGCFG